eukprot:4637066-Amphidinium_carterae.1
MQLGTPQLVRTVWHKMPSSKPLISHLHPRSVQKLSNYWQTCDHLRSRNKCGLLCKGARLPTWPET